MLGTDYLLADLCESDNQLGYLGIAMSNTAQAELHPSVGNLGPGVATVDWRT